MSHVQDSMIMTEIDMWHHNPEYKEEVMTDCKSVAIMQRKYLEYVSKEKKSLLMIQGMTDEKLWPDFQV